MSDKRFALLPAPAGPGASGAAAAPGPTNTAAAAAAAAKGRANAALAAIKYPAWKVNTTLLGTVFSGLFYLSTAVFVILLILVLIHYTLFPIFSFSDEDPGIITVPTASDKQLTFSKGPANYDISANFVGVPSSAYTVGMDVFIAGNFSAMTVPRVLLYRNIEEPVIPPATDTSANLITRFTNTNIVVWLDPVKNDLYVSGITADGTASMLETIRAVQNVPVRQPFRITIVFAPMLLEVYMNGKMEQSIPFKHPLRTIEGEKNYLFPPIRTIDNDTLIGNVAFWPRTLSSREVRIKETGPVEKSIFFNPTNVR
jgi:hypothetical protein